MNRLHAAIFIKKGFLIAFWVTTSINGLKIKHLIIFDHLLQQYKPLQRMCRAVGN
jgi:hypothetical protein